VAPLSRVIVALVERLSKLQTEYKEITKNLALPFVYEEYQQFRDRSEALLQEARTIAGDLNISEPDWIPKS